MLGRLNKLIFLAIVFFISSQVGYHFWPQFSYAGGVRIDYLSPTLYLLDIFILSWIVINLKNLNKIREIKLDSFGRLFLALFILGLLWNTLSAKSVGAHIFGIVKLIEFLLFGFLVAKTFKKEWISPFVKVLSISTLISSALAIWQFKLQSSIGGLWYYFGERTFGLTTVGISTVNLDRLLLRPYASFPHPNVLAFFLLINFVFSYHQIPQEKGIWRYLLVVSFLVSTGVIILTFSRIAIVLLVAFFFYEIYVKLKRKYRYFGLGFLQVVVPFILIFIYANYSTYLLRGIDLRKELFVQSYKIFTSSPYFGIGLNNFFVHQIDLIKTLSPTNFQPPHDIYVVALLSLGIFGLPFFVYLLFKAFVSAYKKLNISRDFYLSVLMCLIGILVVGVFDHFFLTLEQGQLMLALILGLTFTNAESIIANYDRARGKNNTKKISRRRQTGPV